MFRRVLPNDARIAIPNAARRASFAASHLEVRMFNVHDGEAILVIFPGGRTWLIDGGSGIGTVRNRTLGQGLAAYLRARNLVLEVLVPSHPHKDHVGAVPYFLEANPPLASQVTLYRSGDASWNQGVWIVGLNGLNDQLARLGSQLTVVALTNQHREVVVQPDVTAHFFAGSGAAKYTSIFLQLRFRQARLLFTGDSYCRYEKKLLDRFGEADFRADLIKVTHHGSSDGTATQVVQATQPGLAIASTADDGGDHRLEQDTLDRLGGHGSPRRVLETVVDGDIIIKTDGGEYGGGILYEVEFDSPGHFATDLGISETMDLAALNNERTSSQDADCVC